MIAKKYNFKKGSVVLVPFPFTNLESSKVRPAVVLSNLKGEDVMVAFISSKVDKVHDFDVKINQKKNSFLKAESKIICSKLATLERKVILGSLGQLNGDDLPKVEDKLLKVFGLK